MTILGRSRIPQIARVGKRRDMKIRQVLRGRRLNSSILERNETTRRAIFRVFHPRSLVRPAQRSGSSGRRDHPSPKVGWVRATMTLDMGSLFTREGSSLIEDTELGEQCSDRGSVSTDGLGGIRRAGDREEADRRITQSGHDLRTRTLADSTESANAALVSLRSVGWLSFTIQR